LATLGGSRIAEHALVALRAATTTQLVIANDHRAHSWFPDERVVADSEPGLGPLAGIETALVAASGRPVIVLAWDMPFVPAALLVELRHRGSAAANAVVPVHDTRSEPLCAWYAPGALLACRRLLAAGERRAGALAGALRAEWIADAALAPFGDLERMFTSVDTPEALAALGGALP
jgi:molybdopterin-guanine dinucleotide biosynthesis protein A